MVIDGAKTSHHDIAELIRPVMHSANVDRIYYCHGFASHFDANKDKVRALSAAAIVDGNTVDYTLPPHKVFASFQKPIRTQKLPRRWHKHGWLLCRLARNGTWLSVCGDQPGD